MTTLDRYIAKALMIGTGVALLVLLSLDAFFAFFGEAGDIGEGDYGVVEVFRYIGLTLPRRGYDLFPFAVLLGSLLGLGILASNHELVAVRAAGISISRILFSVLMTGLVMQVCATAIGEFIAPAAEQRAQTLREVAKYNRVTFNRASGFWARNGNEFINVHGILPGGRLSGIRIYEMDEDLRLRATTQAHSAEYRDKEWTLFRVRLGHVGDEEVRVTRIPELNREVLIDPELIGVLVVEPDNLSSYDLLHYIAYLKKNGVEVGQYRLAFWTNIAAPVSGLVMLLLSVPFVFGPLRSVGAGQRLLVGLLVGLGFYLLNQTVSRLGQVYDINPVLSVFGPLLLFFCIGLLALRRVR